MTCSSGPRVRDTVPVISRFRVATLLSMLAIALLSTTASAAGEPTRTLSVDDPPTLVVVPNGTATVVFTVTLNGPALVGTERVNVQMATADYCGTGETHLTRWGDYSSMNLTSVPSLKTIDPIEIPIHFLAGGPRAQAVSVPVRMDPAYDGEMFSMKLSNPVGAVISKPVGVGAVVDSPALLDDPFFFDACLSKIRWGSL